MRVLFTTFPEKTHFLAMAPLAWALRTAGHEVCFAVQPKFAGVVTQAGLSAVPIGGDRDLWQLMSRIPNRITVGLGGLPVPYDAAEWLPQEVTWGYLQDGYGQHVKRWHKMSNVPMITELVDFARAWRPDLVIWEPVTYAGAVAAKACGAIHARLLFSLDITGVTRDHFLRLRDQQPPGDRADPLAEWLAGYGHRYGFAFTEDMVTGQFTVGLLPRSLRLEADLRYVPLRYTPYGGPAVVPEWLWTQPDRRRVAITMGLSVGEHQAEYGFHLPEVLDALADLDLEVVAAVPGSGRLDPRSIPDNARVVSYVPLHALLPGCAAAIHHGGFGTLATTALHAVPQLVLPWDNDGPALARRVAASGAGLAIHTSQVTGRTVRECLLRLLDEPGFRAGAARLRGEMLAMPTPNEVVGELVELVTEYRCTPVATAA